MLSAGLSGGTWSLDAPDFRSGSTRPAVGMTVVAIMPGTPGDGRIARAREQASRLEGLGVFIPGVSGVEIPPFSKGPTMPRGVYETICGFAFGGDRRA